MPTGDAMPSCACEVPPFYVGDYQEESLGDDDALGGEVSLQTCKTCGTSWLKYLLESPHHSRSSRWWRVRVPAERKAQLTAQNARDFIERQAEGFQGGSLFDSTGMPVKGPMRIR